MPGSIKKLPEKTTLRLEYDGGVVDGKTNLKKVNYSKIRMSATDKEMYDTALEIQSLSKETLLNVKRSDDSKLTTV